MNSLIQTPYYLETFFETMEHLAFSHDKNTIFKVAFSFSKHLQLEP